MSISISKIKQELRKSASKEKAQILQRFFKTGPGEYGEGDIFIGVQVPAIRKLSKQCSDTSLKDLAQLLKSTIHEERLLALLILVLQYKNSDKENKRKIFDLYLSNTKYINNWDLIDLTAYHIVGQYLVKKSKVILYSLARSRCLWERRISILSTFYYIKQNKFEYSLKIAKILLNDEHDLIHKAVGWMLREIGKRDQAVEENFLMLHYKKMPRTMLRYAIERFSEPKRQAYLKGIV
ncbi:DNA alkylation repair protein [Candidatus Omnitrophota bacterium]